MQSMEGLHCCNTCGKTFASIDKLKRHERIHTGEKPYVCNICGKKFSRGEHLKQHERIHTGEKPHVGKTCEKSFSQLAYLKEHEKVHSGEKPYVCKTCNKAFSQLGSLRTHEIIHIGKKPYVCNVCGKGFSRRDYVMKHYRIHREQKLQCVTQKRISKKSSSKDCCLKYLKNIDVGQKSVAMIWNKQEKKSRFAVKPFGCRVCDELFVEENHFLTHCSLHFGDSDISQDSIFHSDCHGIVSKENLKEGFAIKELSNELAIESNADEIRGNSLRWFGHTEMIN